MKQEHVGIFNQLLLWQKFLILGLVTLLLVAVPSYLYITNGQKQINTYEQGRVGLNIGSQLIAILKSTQKDRGLAAVVLFGDKSKAEDLQKEKAKITKLITAFDANFNTIDAPELAEKWKLVKANWQELSSYLDSSKVDRDKLWELHTHQIDLLKEALTLTLSRFSMTLDAYPQSYFLVQGIMINLPELFDQMGLARAFGREFLERKTSSSSVDQREIEKYRALLIDKVRLSRTSLKANASSLLLSVSNIPDLKKKLEDRIKNLFQLSDVPLKLSDKVVDTNTKSYPTIDDFRSKYNDATDATYELINTSIDALNEQFDKQIGQVKSTQNLIIASMLTIFAIGAALTLFIVRSINRPVNKLVDVMNKLAAGDSSVRANMQSSDELGVLGRQFDAMVNQREALRSKIEQENDTLNNSVIDLLQAVAKLAQRDLTVRVPVAEDITGPVGDALNLLSDETSKVLSRVVQIANEVSMVSDKVRSQSTNVINVAAEEKREVEQAAVELDEASKAMREIAGLAFSCNEAAQKAINNTDKAQESVLSTVGGITTIRDTIRETEKRIKRLGERSQEIGGVVNLINEISERTHILALNASMHAASAGEAGRGFSVVANEVQKLAENSREATKKIAALVNNIQVETADTVVTMNNAISQVVQGTEMAQQAGNEMRQTRDTTAELVQLVQRIAHSSTLQAQTSDRLVERAHQIQKNTDQTYNQLQEQGLQTDELVNLAKNLVSSVGVFTLPKAVS